MMVNFSTPPKHKKMNTYEKKVKQKLHTKTLLNILIMYKS